MDEGYELLDGDYFSKSDEEDEELKNAAAEGKNHVVTKNSKIEIAYSVTILHQVVILYFISFEILVIVRSLIT